MMASGLGSGRREFLRNAMVLAAAVESARTARAAGEPLGVLGPEQATTVEMLGDTLLPGAAAGGIAHFLDAQLRKSPEQALLTLRYLDVPPPYGTF